MSGSVLALIAAVALVWLLAGGPGRLRSRRHDGQANGGSIPGSGNGAGCASPGGGGGDGGGD